MCCTDSWLSCTRCFEKYPAEAIYCMRCGKKTGKTQQDRMWPGEILRIAHDADMTLLEEAIRAAFGQLPNGRQSITNDEIQTILPRLTEKQGQVLIRAFNLDKKGVRPRKEISAEMGSSVRAVMERVDWALACVNESLEIEYYRRIQA